MIPLEGVEATAVWLTDFADDSMFLGDDLTIARLRTAGELLTGLAAEVERLGPWARLACVSMLNGHIHPGLAPTFDGCKDYPDGAALNDALALLDSLNGGGNGLGEAAPTTR